MQIELDDDFHDNTQAPAHQEQNYHKDQHFNDLQEISSDDSDAE